MSVLEHMLFGSVHFADAKEFRAFQFKLLCIVLPVGALTTVLLLLGVASGANLIDARHVISMSVFTTLSVVLWLLLRGQPQRFLRVAWPYEILCLLEYVSALYFVSEDEMRVIWFFTNIPGVYILLGQRAGLAITVLSVVGLALGNGLLPRPYSSNGMATLLAALAYVGAFFHVYGARSLSYFFRMRESNGQLRHMASHDPLTGLLNARAYYAACDQMIHLATRNRTPYAVLFVDLDHFKRINDTHGHEAGDLVLKCVAARLMETVRQSDAVGRVGGEEFSVFLPNTDLAGALRLAESLRLGIEALMPDIGSQRLRITASIGVARNQHSEQSMAEIQRLADQAMYDAKQRGRNRVSAVELDQAAMV
ncbi:GGDEF domain-containing protein [Uliginosibacterium sp. 31-16]|uniref:GGDEF domain-containing protein n=1 Tax=Uliginosibacterium sp. 31-16 TaxID=3068315 RepID=UPI00273D855E|nr:GGDEF domain-containing protein [Uliginosibacterium sp. 31-16]MDP5241381.1 GGDEF domain-containing protein [Uliginosibacterium sp. 31-16]